jgi:glucose/mannose-6-phosphate isomerase
MKQYCKEREIDIYELKMINSPRVSFVNFLFPILKTLENIVKIKENDMKKTLESLEKTRKNISSENLSNSNKALRLAEWLEPTPVIYYPYGLKAAAIRFKNSLQENSKMHVINEDLIEACHNGIVAWEQNSTSKPIFIRGKNDHPQTKRRWDILKEYFNDRNISYKEVISEEDSIFSKLINLIYVLDYTSIYKAILLKIDPTPVKSIDFVKERYDFKHI